MCATTSTNSNPTGAGTAATGVSSPSQLLSQSMSSHPMQVIELGCGVAPAAGEYV
jgi:hypothetical protein